MPRRPLNASAPDSPALYHCISRVVDRRFIFEETQKARFVKMLRAVAKFSNVRVLSYCVLSNHFHLLIEVPPVPDLGLSDTEFLGCLEALYSRHFVRDFASTLAGFREQGENQLAHSLRAPYEARMFDLSQFMKTLKQRFSIWYNRHHDRVGTLWEDRFRSLIVESAPWDGRGHNPLAAVAAYIHTNCIRAGIDDNPARYRWSTLGAASGGDSFAKASMARLRELTGQTSEPFSGVEPELVDLMHSHRIRYFSEGIAIGGRSFLRRLFRDNREYFAGRRWRGAIPMGGLRVPGMFTMCGLRCKEILRSTS